MHTAHVLTSIAASVIITMTTAFSADSTHSFTFGRQEFLLDGKPFQIISGEVHPTRVPQEYWKHRIQMAKAMGCNTIAAYVFWNYHESEPGAWGSTAGNRDLRQFFRLVQEEGMWALLRPGPCVCVSGARDSSDATFSREIWRCCGFCINCDTLYPGVWKRS